MICSGSNVKLAEQGNQHQDPRLPCQDLCQGEDFSLLQVFRIQMICSGFNVKLKEQGNQRQDPREVYAKVRIVVCYKCSGSSVNLRNKGTNAKILASRAEVYAKVSIVVCYKCSGSW